MGSVNGYFVVPHPPIAVHEIGKGEESRIENTINAYMKVAEEIKEIAPDTIVFITPHGPLFKDAIAINCEDYVGGNFMDFGVPQLKFNADVDNKLTEDIIRRAERHNIPYVRINRETAYEYNVSCNLDHGVMVPMYFINKKYNDYKIVHITYGLLKDYELYEFGKTIANAASDSNGKVVVVASGDMSHRLKDDGPYSYDPAGPEFDKNIVDIINSGKLEKIFYLDKTMVKNAGECGLRSLYILCGTLDAKEYTGKVYSYEGPFGVGYCVAGIVATGSNGKSLVEELKLNHENGIKKKRENEDSYIRLARESLEHYLKYGKLMDVPDYVPKEMLERESGVFVSIKKDDVLRGCIGTIEPACNNIALEIIRNAVEAGCEDPRFYPVKEDELSDLVYSVDVLEPPQSTDKEGLDPEKYGVIVTCGMRRGLLLPNLEGVNTVDEQINIACKKAGIKSYENYLLKRFEVVRHS